LELSCYTCVSDLFKSSTVSTNGSSAAPFAIDVVKKLV